VGWKRVIKCFKELLYIRCHHWGHECSAVKVPQAKAKLRQELLPDKPLCLRARNLVSYLNLTRSKCKRKQTMIDYRNAHKELKDFLLRKKAWLYKREREKLESFLEQIKSGKGLMWNQVEAFEDIRQDVYRREEPRFTFGGRGSDTA